MNNSLELRRCAGFHELSGAWEQLRRRAKSCNVFTRFDWQAAWWTYFGGGSELLLWALWDGHDLVGVAPLMKTGRFISFVGGRAVSDYLDLIVAAGYEGALIAGVLDALETAEWDYIALRGLRAESVCFSVLSEIARSRGWFASLRNEDVSPVLKLPGSWDDYLATLSKKDRHELRRKMRRLDNNGPWCWFVRCGDGLEPSDVDEFIRLLRLSRREKALFMDERMEEFFRTVLSSLAADGVVRLYFLEIGGARAATCLCFEVGDAIWLYNSGFDPTYSALSPGLILKALCIKDAISLHKAEFDFLRGCEPYKRDLGGVDVPVYCLVLTRERVHIEELLCFGDEHYQRESDCT